VISIVLATYDRAATLPRAIDSVLRQTYADWELIIVDDGSRDETGELLSALRDPRIRVCRHPVNRGVDAAKNTGFDHIRGEWFTTLDSDDEMMPEALVVLLACAERTGATAVACNGRDAVSGRLTGGGPTHDGWLSIADSARLRGDHWGITLTSLLGDSRFDERSSGRGLWLKVNARARRYYVHRALLVVHTEGADRVTTGLRAAGIRKRGETFALLGEDEEYLAVLAAADPRAHRRVLRRVRAARLLRPFFAGKRKAGGPSS
jgi:glycosyltransferase involved in cell wall biosynthesis